MSEHRPRLDPALTRIDETAFVAPGATVIGDVTVGPEASIWFGTVLRGDVDSIRVGARSNVQDLTVLHADPGVPCVVGEDVTIGHRAIVHGARVEDFALIGMGAIVMNGAHVGRESLVAAGALVPEGMEISPRTMVRGVPARVARELTDEEVEGLHRSAAHYVENARGYRAFEKGETIP